MSHVMAYHMTLLALQTRPNYSWMFNVNCSNSKFSQTCQFKAVNLIFRKDNH